MAKAKRRFEAGTCPKCGGRSFKKAGLGAWRYFLGFTQAMADKIGNAGKVRCKTCGYVFNPAYTDHPARR